MLIYQSQIKTILDRVLSDDGDMRKTNDIKYHCVKCKHAKKKLEINLNTGEYHCWVCHFRGSSILSLLKNVGASESTISEVKKIYSENGKSTADWDKIVSPEKETKKELKLPVGFSPLFKTNKKSKAWANVLKYARSRGFDQYDIVRHNMGYVEWGEFENRLIVPSYSIEGKLNFFSARSINDNSYRKYMNSQVPSNEIVGFEFLIDFKQPINIVEGALDAVTLSHNTIPLFGKNISKALRIRLIENDTPEVRILLDADADRESFLLAERLSSIGKSVRIVSLNGKDPNEIGRLKTLEMIDKSKPYTFLDTMKYKLKFKI